MHHFIIQPCLYTTTFDPFSLLTIAPLSTQQMIWEVDENLDNMIDFDELQLTYHRNIGDASGNEPCFFFKLLEVRI